MINYKPFEPGGLQALTTHIHLLLLPPPAPVPSPAALALLAAILLDTVTEILEVLVSGRLGGVPGGESRFKLLAIMREAAAGRKGESPVQWPWEGGRLEASLGTEWGRSSQGSSVLCCPPVGMSGDWVGQAFQELAYPSLPCGSFLRPKTRLVPTILHPSVSYQPRTDLDPPLHAPLQPSCSLGPARSSNRSALPLHAGLLSDGLLRESFPDHPSTCTPLPHTTLSLSS